MPAIWSSSERPLSVRTVWVDGIRHAVLSPDDPLIATKLHRRPHTSKSNDYRSDYRQLESTGLERLTSCFVNLHVMMEKDSSSSQRVSKKIVRRQSSPSCTRLLETLPVAKDIGKLITDHGTIEDFSIETKSINDTQSGSSIDKVELPDIHSNLLSERVLQWLDLSGKVYDYVQEEEVRQSSKMDEYRDWNPVVRKKYSLNKPEISSCVGKRRITVTNCKLDREHKPECFQRNSRRMARRKLAEVEEERLRKEELIKIEETSWEEATKIEEDETKIMQETQKTFTNSWSAVGRPQLHIFMPKLNCNEKRRVSSQESLVFD